MKRHQCVICNMKRYENRMTSVPYTNSWVCTLICLNHHEVDSIQHIGELASKLTCFSIHNLKK